MTKGKKFSVKKIPKDKLTTSSNPRYKQIIPRASSPIPLRVKSKREATGVAVRRNLAHFDIFFFLFGVSGRHVLQEL
jgi:hypothetical protein